METTLNNVQQQIVEDTEGAIMVLAGAGSGKTRVLTHRIAHILRTQKARPYEILAITFTNKAANEIKNRIFSMGVDAMSVWAMTFHSMCCRILRLEAHHLDGYRQNFSIFDEQDKKSVIKKILKDKNVKDDNMLSMVSDKLSKYKMSNLTFDDYKALSCFTETDKTVFAIMKEYEEQMHRENAMDFDDLINKTLFLLKTNVEVREKYQQKFRYIMVDEFQDTNETQYELVKTLGAYHKNVFAVGDEDQSIYSWRGANVGNIQHFLHDFAGAKLYKLEQNYRSTKTIIDAANKIIKVNQNRIDKTLFTENNVGANVVYSKSYSDREEADFVTKTILSLVESKGYKYSDIAVLMRLNALTRNFEEKFVSYDIPYKVFGGLKFYERAEIKNVMAYLKLLVNPFDDESFLRVVNFPKRGIGDGALEKLKAISLGRSLMETVFDLNDNEGGTLQKFIPFKNLMLDFTQKQAELELFEFAKYVVDESGILSEYQDDTDEAMNRKLNIGELLQNIKNYAEDNPDKSLVDFLQTVSLATDIDSYHSEDDSVVLATVHSVKGLEFKVVFIVGLEERFFPIIRFDSEEDEMEEERRLMYVAITRAKERLYLTSSRSRFMYGKQSFSQVSRFLKELGYELPKESHIIYDDSEYDSFQSHKYGNHNSYSKSTFSGSLNSFAHKSAAKTYQPSFAVGDRVSHPNFGTGYVVFLDKATKTIKIDFDNFGNKVLSLGIAPIKKI